MAWLLGRGILLVQLLLLSSFVITGAANVEMDVIPGAYIVEFADHLDNVSFFVYSPHMGLTNKARKRLFLRTFNRKDPRKTSTQSLLYRIQRRIFPSRRHV